MPNFKNLAYRSLILALTVSLGSHPTMEFGSNAKIVKEPIFVTHQK